MTDPAYREHKPGTLIALWVVNQAARQRRQWARRGCFFPELVKYHETQGFSLNKEQDRTSGHLYLLARRSERIDLDQLGMTENLAFNPSKSTIPANS